MRHLVLATVWEPETLFFSCVFFPHNGMPTYDLCPKITPRKALFLTHEETKAKFYYLLTVTELEVEELGFELQSPCALDSCCLFR